MRNNLDAYQLAGRLLVQAGVDTFGVCPFNSADLRVPTRAAARVPKGTRSLLVAAFPYYVGSFSYRNLSRYAMIPDYHDVASALLGGVCTHLSKAFPSEAFEPFCDISPFDEVALAVRAGLGFRGRNGLLINPRYGSYLFLGEIASTLSFPCAAPSPAQSCVNCGACAAQCPGRAIGPSPEGFRREACLSHLTQKKRLSAGEAEAVLRGGFVWGCDVCSDVCPLNRRAAYSPIPAFYRNICAAVSHNNLDRVFSGRAWTWRGREVLERNLDLIETGGASVGNHSAESI